jgi:superfamily II DNA or RNA helicase
MLIDNRTDFSAKGIKEVHEFLRKNTQKGPLDIVTGFFSLGGLEFLQDKVNASAFRLILAEIVLDKTLPIANLDLVRGSLSLQNALEGTRRFDKALEFLRRKDIEIKTVQKAFCHAKVYQHTAPDEDKNYYILGSSNLTEAGLGLRESSNLELNTAIKGIEHNDWMPIRNWFKDLWDKVAVEFVVPVPGQGQVSVRDYFIQIIENLQQEFTPEQLYYKVLYELFKSDLYDVESDGRFKADIKHLEETGLYNSLYEFQKRAAITLIKALDKYNGAILGDAVGLGKTWTGLSVMKFYEMKGYKVLILCPKKLGQNWFQYLVGTNSRFERDKLHYIVRYHSDLQDDRLWQKDDQYRKEAFINNPKLLVVIDESHNLRNDKSGRYQFLVDNILKQNKEVKVLHLSATPINTSLNDLRNQFKLMVKGENEGFKDILEISSMESLFKRGVEAFNKWTQLPERVIADFINMVPRDFFVMTDALIVARTRKMIYKIAPDLKEQFPEKKAPINKNDNQVKIDHLQSFAEILDALPDNLTAYKPHQYMSMPKKKGETEEKQDFNDQAKREGFLVRMMHILLVKRLESSWYSFDLTVGKILAHHENALKKVADFEAGNRNAGVEETQDDEVDDENENAGSVALSQQEQAAADDMQLGKKNPILIKDIVNLEGFKKDLNADVAKLQKLQTGLKKFKLDFVSGQEKDVKLEALCELLKSEKASNPNKKVLIFTMYKDTAEYVFEQLGKKGFDRIAMVTGSESRAKDEPSLKEFTPILERFSPLTKMMKEKDWSQMEGSGFMASAEFKAKTPYAQFDEWSTWIAKSSPSIKKEILDKPIDILVATDCISEGQNLQDCDTVINYDIHWNPVRLIQRMGRIDRLGSPNKQIQGVNFWPADGIEGYLKLAKRVDERLKMMSLVGAETGEDHPLMTEQEEKMMRQMENTWEDIEGGAATLGLNDLSFDPFRQDLIDYFSKNKEELEAIPKGVFSGFVPKQNIFKEPVPDGIIGILGYPAQNPNLPSEPYKEIHVLFVPTHPEKATSAQIEHYLNANQYEILSLLREHKLEDRYVPEEVQKGEKEAVDRILKGFDSWFTSNKPKIAVTNYLSALSGKTMEDTKTEDKWKPENFDLINWFVVSN